MANDGMRNTEMMEDAELQGKYLVFEIDENYALELSKVKEILEYKPVTAVPETPAYIAGVMNLRGSVVPVIDMRKRFHKPEKADLQRRCTIIIHFENALLGLMVDNVTDLIDIAAGSISPPPQVGADYAHVFIKSIGVCSEKMLLIVDTDRLVNHSDLQFLETVEGE